MPAANPTPPIVHRLTWPDSYKIKDAAKGISRRAAIGIDNSQELLDQKPYDLPLYFKTTSGKYYLINGDWTDADLREIADREAYAKYPLPDLPNFNDVQQYEQYKIQYEAMEGKWEDYREELLKNLLSARDKAKAYSEGRNGNVPVKAPFILGKRGREGTLKPRPATENGRAIKKAIERLLLSYSNESERATGNIGARATDKIQTEDSRKIIEQNNLNVRGYLDGKKFQTESGRVYTVAEVKDYSDKRKGVCQSQRIQRLAPKMLTYNEDAGEYTFAFMTVTLEGKKHARTSQNSRASTFDGSTVAEGCKILIKTRREAQKTVAKTVGSAPCVWGIEPHQDGTPHEHMTTQAEYALKLALEIGDNPKIRGNRQMAVRIIDVTVTENEDGEMETAIKPRAICYASKDDYRRGRSVERGRTFPAVVDLRIFRIKAQTPAEAASLAQRLSQYVIKYTTGASGNQSNTRNFEEMVGETENTQTDAERAFWRKGYNIQNRTTGFSNTGLSTESWKRLDAISQSRNKKIPPEAKASARLVLSEWVAGRLEEYPIYDESSNCIGTGIGTGPDCWVFLKSGETLHKATGYTKVKTTELLENAPRIELNDENDEDKENNGLSTSTGALRVYIDKGYSNNDSSSPLARQAATLTAEIAAKYILASHDSIGAVCEAAAGAGKTHTLALAVKMARRYLPSPVYKIYHQIGWASEEQRIPPESILILAMMRKAAAEIFDKLTELGVPAELHRSTDNGGALRNNLHIHSNPVRVMTVAKWLRLVENWPEREQQQRIIIDEMQDIAPEMLLEIQEHASYTGSSIRLALGDSRQTLMPFVEPEQVAEQWAFLKPFSMDSSRRCADKIADFANKLAPNLENIKGNGKQGTTAIRHFRSKKEAREHVISKALEMLATNPNAQIFIQSDTHQTRGELSGGFRQAALVNNKRRGHIIPENVKIDTVAQLKGQTCDYSFYIPDIDFEGKSPIGRNEEYAYTAITRAREHAELVQYLIAA